MNERIRQHMEYLFLSAPKTRRANDLRDELVSNLTARYNDLVAGGMEEEAAYKTTIDGIGDIEDLIGSLREQEVFDPVQAQIQRQKSALLISSGVALYIVSLIFPILSRFAFGGESVLAFILMILCWAAATMLLVYNGVSKPKYVKRDDNLVEDFKEWKSDKVKTDATRKSVYSIVWMMTVLVFFLLGIFFDAWHPGWLVFLLAPVITQIMKLFSVYKGE